MDDESIIGLYWQRDEAALRLTEKKYGSYLAKIAYNILRSHEDSEESVNETYMSAWKTIPPQRPSSLSAYLAKITRRISISTLRKRSCQKRMPSEYMVSLTELEDCVPSGGTAENDVDARLLGEAVNRFLRTLPDDTRDLFICRYFFSDPVRETSGRLGMSESKAKSILHRTRIKLKAYLEKEGYL